MNDMCVCGHLDQDHKDVNSKDKKNSFCYLCHCKKFESIDDSGEDNE